MLSKTRKIVLVIFMILISLMIEATVYAGYMMSNNQKTIYISNFIYDIGITRWGWLPVFFLAGSSIVLTTKWKLGNITLRSIIIFISMITIIIAALWLFGIHFISHLKP